MNRGIVAAFAGLRHTHIGVRRSARDLNVSKPLNPTARHRFEDCPTELIPQLPCPAACRDVAFLSSMFLIWKHEKSTIRVVGDRRYTQTGIAQETLWIRQCLGREKDMRLALYLTLLRAAMVCLGCATSYHRAKYKIK
jgi:hypothetical protein